MDTKKLALTTLSLCLLGLHNPVHAQSRSAADATSRATQSVAAWDQCYVSAQDKYAISADLLRAVARVESSNQPQAINTSHIERTGTVDIGLMQINSSNLSWLSRQGIDRAALKNPCTSIDVGAKILRQLVDKHGPSWQAVGAYNAACTQLKGEACLQARNAYVRKVQIALANVRATPWHSPPSVPRSLVSVVLQAPEAQGNHTLNQVVSPMTAQDTSLNNQAPDT